MSTFIKEFEHRGYSVIQKVELNSTDTVDDKKHTITTSCIAVKNYLVKDTAQSHMLETYINEQLYDALAYIDKFMDTPTTEVGILEKLGFTETK